MKAEGIKLLDTWRVMGMRGTGSHDIELTDVFIPDSGVSHLERWGQTLKGSRHLTCRRSVGYSSPEMNGRKELQT